MVTLVLVIIVVSLLILVHEWGHFYAARKLGVRVEEFGFGFPPRLLSFVKNGVKYSFNLLPLGGYVKIFGEQGEGEGDKKSFISKPIYHRFVILAAGVFMNILAAWFFFSASSLVGIPQLGDEEEFHGIPVSIVAISPNSPAEKVGLKVGDKIIEMRSRDLSLRVEFERDIQDFISAYLGEEITLVVQRGRDVHSFAVTPRIGTKKGEGPLGIALGRISISKIPWYLAPAAGFKTLLTTFWFILEGLYMVVKDLVTSGRTPASISGPVGIFLFARDTWLFGVGFFLQFVGIISVNLAILNFLPIPALDGGRALFLVIEKLRGKRINMKLENTLHTIGFAVLIGLLVFVTYRDIIRIV